MFVHVEGVNAKRTFNAEEWHIAGDFLMLFDDAAEYQQRAINLTALTIEVGQIVKIVSKRE